MTIKTKTSFEARLSLLAGNLVSVVPTSVPTIVLGGESFTPSVLQTDLQTDLALFTAVDAARSLSREALAKRKAGEPAVKARYDAVVSYLRVILAGDSAALEKVGLKPATERSAPTVQTKMAAQLKRTQTAASKKAPATPPVKVVMYGPNGQPLPGSAEVPAPTAGK